MFTYATLVGCRFGTWLKSEARFETFERAQAEALAVTTAERRAGITPFQRRAIRA